MTGRRLLGLRTLDLGQLSDFCILFLRTRRFQGGDIITPLRFYTILYNRHHLIVKAQLLVFDLCFGCCSKIRSVPLLSRDTRRNAEYSLATTACIKTQSATSSLGWKGVGGK